MKDPRAIGVGRVMTIGIPIQASASPVVDSVHRQTRSCSSGEEQWPCEVGVAGVGCTENQVSIAGQDTHMIGMLVERGLPSDMGDNEQKYLFDGRQVRIEVFWLVRI